MGFEYLTNIPLAKAREDYLSLLCSYGYGPRTEVIPVWDACGRVTAHAVYAHICAPHYAASAMDGVAVHAKDTFGATETTPITLLRDSSSSWIPATRFPRTVMQSSWWRMW